uniref:E10-like protein n=1 Tax=Siphoviridae sp. ctoyo6 TaxID=2825674 RepID=A0A8S5U379_9CAUD|nr:MAG TPA: E10-like protein [Siphoviridae sp. ctoyo6]
MYPCANCPDAFEKIYPVSPFLSSIVLYKILELGLEYAICLSFMYKLV